MPSSILRVPSVDGTANGFKMPRTTTLSRPTWFSNASGSSSTTLPADSMTMRHTPLGPTSSSSSSGSNQSLSSSGSGSTLGGGRTHNFASPGNPFALPLTTRNPKHRLSPSPSPNKYGGGEDDFVMISPIRSALPQISPQSRRMTDMSSSPIDESPTPACGMASATARLRLGDVESPTRSAPFPQPLFPIPRSHSQDKIPRLSTSHPLRARASTGSQKDHERPILSGSKKTISLDRIQSALTLGPADRDEAFGSMPAPASALGHARRTSKGTLGPARHRRGASGDHTAQASISRSTGHKSGLALSLGGLPDFSYHSNSSLSSLSTNNMTPPASTFSPAEPPIFEDIKPLQEAFEQPSTALRKFKPRDSGVSVGGEREMVEKLMPRRPPMLKRTSSMGDQRPLETPIEPSHTSGWPTTSAFNFLVGGDLPAMGMGRMGEDEKPEMPDTPIKRNHAVKRGIGHSSSQPSLGSGATASVTGGDKGRMPPPTMRKKSGTIGAGMGMVPHLTLNGSSGQASSSPDRDGDGSPTVRTGSQRGGDSPMGMGSMLLNTPSKLPTLPSIPARQPLAPIHPSSSNSGSGIYPRLSLPAFANPKVHRTLHHRQSHPATKAQKEEESVFESKFILLETLGKGAFSTVFKVQDRHGEGVWAVKKARGVFDGVRDRLRHLEEVDILRHLSNPPSPHVIKFESAWEQSRQLFIQTELCLGTLAFFLEEYGRVVERLDEGRVWKIIRELSDGINHIHSGGVVHFDLKPANILISDQGTLKIGDFGMGSRVPRVHPSDILRGSGLGGEVGGAGEVITGWEKLEREGDRVYMPPEMLQGVFVPAADLFSFGLIILEVSTNICVPDGGPAWHSLRTDDFTVVDLSPLSPALADLITHCMASDPTSRPTSKDVVNHPVIQRARTGGAALAPESKEWLGNVLGGFGYMPQNVVEGEGEGDVEMLDA